MDTNETLVVMAKAPRVGQVKTRLHPALGANASTELYRAFLADTLALARLLARNRPSVEIAFCYAPSDGFDDFVSLDLTNVRAFAQRGDDLGARLANCFLDLAAARPGPTVAIGADSPTLPWAYLAQAFDDLSTDADLVLGPTEDGGYYAVGMRTPRPQIFAGVAWSTDRVLEQTQANAVRLHLNTSRLPAWFDVDELPELERLACDLARGASTAEATRAVLLDRTVASVLGRFGTG